MDTDLHQLIRSNQDLSEEHVCFIVYQMFRGLNFIHGSGILHRDLKPSNILLNANCGVQLCYFGLACFDDDRTQFGTSEPSIALVSW